MTALKAAYGTPITSSTGSLASDANLLASRQSNINNNTGDLAIGSIVRGALGAPGAAPTTAMHGAASRCASA